MPDSSVPENRVAPRQGRPALRRLLPAGVAVDEFAARYWGRQPLHHHAPDQPALLTLADVDELLSRRGLRTPFLRVVKDGVVLPTSRYTSGGGVGAAIGDQVADDRVLGLFADGATVVLQGLHRLWPPVIDFATRLAADLGHPGQVNAYITPPGNCGFDPHYDVHDVFVLQTAGRKTWRVHAPVHPDPLPDQPWTDHRAQIAARMREEPLLEVTMRPGDVLYLPRGTLHAATAGQEVSCHLTIGIHPTTRQHLVEALLGAAKDEPELRRSLPLGFDLDDPDALAAELRATVAALGRLLDGADPAALADRLAPTLLRQTRPAPLAPIGQAAALAALGPGDEIRWRPGLSAHLSADGTLILPTRRLALVPAQVVALEEFRRVTVCRVGDLPGLPPAGRLEFARLLLREGIAVPARGGGSEAGRLPDGTGVAGWVGEADAG